MIPVHLFACLPRGRMETCKYKGSPALRPLARSSGIVFPGNVQLEMKMEIAHDARVASHPQTVENLAEDVAIQSLALTSLACATDAIEWICVVVRTLAIYRRTAISRVADEVASRVAPLPTARFSNAISRTPRLRVWHATRAHPDDTHASRTLSISEKRTRPGPSAESARGTRLPVLLSAADRSDPRCRACGWRDAGDAYSEMGNRLIRHTECPSPKKDIVVHVCARRWTRLGSRRR
ncbi:hypothetical protein PHLGIDRAFT_277257 [Phlebiopsis gigantea 11061_1 CR5-6]|uniref:Uncharacterized protein n=1 Tax=Phlebiopsis gigantea (strain 11061_1 CR5-6) TaxID=745531 RepID=A0A0C3S465_PHLG1|nr:hypothetical protein PHLGIDRAFT_277257 [Phlebiopsis gigantea 11061_1 CR5-6]